MDDDAAEFLENVDRSAFKLKTIARKVTKPWGYELHWVDNSQPYMGKVLHIDAGKRLSLQAHDKKTESWLLINGQAKLIIENENGDLEEIEMEAGKGYFCRTGQRHRLAGITDCDIVEVSTPEVGTTYRLEDDYERQDETDEQREQPNRGWQAN